MSCKANQGFLLDNRANRGNLKATRTGTSTDWRSDERAASDCPVRLAMKGLRRPMARVLKQTQIQLKQATRLGTETQIDSSQP